MNRASKLAVSFFATLILIIFSPLASQAASSITPEQALGPAGSAQTVCGKVVSANYLPQHAKAPTFLNLNQRSSALLLDPCNGIVPPDGVKAV